MKIRAFVFSFLGACITLADEPAQVVGPIADGSPQPVPPVSVKLEVRPEDVISSKVVDLGDRKVTVQEIAPVELPAIATSGTDFPPTPEGRTAATAQRGNVPSPTERIRLLMSVSVYRSEAYPGKVRTLFRWWSQDRSREFQAWSNVDGCWLSGFGEFKSGGISYALLFGIGEQDLDKQAESMARRGVEFTRPQIPDLPHDAPAFVVTKGDPSPEEISPIRAIHDLIRNEGERLRLANEGRKQAQRAREEEEKAHPSKPKDITLNFWRVQKQPATDKTQNGGEQ